MGQMVREESGGEMLKYWQLNPMPAEEFVIERAGREVLQFIESYRAKALSGAPAPPAPHQPPKLKKVAKFRAGGNRSILADPRRSDIKEMLNAKIKRRESFRPFAPSILREAVAEWFEQDDDVPFMMEVFQIRPEKRSLLPAVCHVDGSGRLQTVHADTNPLYHQLISEFCRLTSIPIVLNTSFNENEPVVCRPEEALDCFLRTKMDVLVLGNFYIARES